MEREGWVGIQNLRKLENRQKRENLRTLVVVLVMNIKMIWRQGIGF